MPDVPASFQDPIKLKLESPFSFYPSEEASELLAQFRALDLYPNWA